MNKHEREHRLRGLRKSGKPGGEGRMRFAGIDIGGERHAHAVVNEGGATRKGRNAKLNNITAPPPLSGGGKRKLKTRHAALIITAEQ